MSVFKAYRISETCPVCKHKGGACKYRGPIEAPFCVLCFRQEKGCSTNKHGKPIAAKDGMGWMHNLRDDPDFCPRTRRAQTQAPSVPSFIPVLARSCHASMSPFEIDALAESLFVSPESLSLLRVGWCKSYVDAGGKETTANAFTFPMRDERYNVIGIKFRNHAKYKWSVKGSLNGLFILSRRIISGPLVVVEGPTECAAVFDLGYSVIGRPGNTSGRDLVVKFCQRISPRTDIVILRNNDPHGSDAERLTLMGADSLAQELIEKRAARSVKIVAPPKTKDARDWKRAGATKQTIEDAIKNASYWRSNMPAMRVG